MQNAQPIMGGNGNMMSGRLDGMLNGAGFEPMRRLGYAGNSPPLTAMRRTAEMATQTSESNDMARVRIRNVMHRCSDPPFEYTLTKSHGGSEKQKKFIIC